MARSGSLTKQELENIKSFRYKTNGFTPLETYVYDHFWTILANNCLPDWLAPNALTLIGLVFPLICLVTICYLDPTFTQTLPCWVWFLSWFSDFWYQTIDAIDGKQARRTDNCSPLGQILDHNLDQITFTCMMVHVCATLRIEDNIFLILMITPGVMSAHYSIEYRTHFTHMHQTVIGVIGATEQLLIIQTATFLCGIYSNEAILLSPVTVPVLNIVTTWKHITILSAFISGAHYNLENIIVAIKTAKDKKYALGCLLPYFQFFSMMYASSLSPLYKDYVAYFLILCGLHLTWVTAIFNLSSTAGAKFDWLFLEPLAFFLIVCADSTAVLPGGQAKLAYVSFFLWTLTRYLLLMKNIVQQITTHMGLRFLKVKPRVKTAKAD